MLSIVPTYGFSAHLGSWQSLFNSSSGHIIGEPPCWVCPYSPWSIPPTPRDPRRKSWLDFYVLEEMTSFRLNTHPIIWQKEEYFLYVFFGQYDLATFAYQVLYIQTRAKVQKEVLSKDQTGPVGRPARLAPNSRHKWIATSYWPIQHIRSKSSQKTYPRENRNHLLLFFRKVLDTYSVMRSFM